MLCFCIFNFNHVTGFAKEISTVFESIQTLEFKSMQEITSKPILTQDLAQTSQQIYSEPKSESEILTNISNGDSKNNWIKFKLEYPSGYPKIDDNEFDDLYNTIFYVNEDNSDEIMKSKIAMWMNGSAVNTPLENAINSQSKSAGYYSEIESEFTNEGGRRLSSDLLDEVINGREALMQSYPNGTLAWLLANHYQTYALNYLNQTNDQRSILYFYMKAIYNAQKSLEFEMDIKNKKSRIEYIQFRYKDIAECELLDNDVRLKAYKILTSMENTLNESK